MIRDPSEKELQAWQKRYNESRDRHAAYMGFQKYVYDLFESVRRETGLLLIRGIIPRDSVKSFDSIVEKILERRERQREQQRAGKLSAGAKPYQYDDVKDHVGIKVLCPYRENSDQVASLLFSRFREEQRLRVEEKNPRAGRRDEEGYKGYNFTVLPGTSTPADWTGLTCEVQIKTLLEEAWDAKTHDLLYKRKRLVSPELSKQFDLLSEALEVVERQSGGIRKLVEEIPREEEAQKTRAALVFFSKVMQAGPPGATQITHGHEPLPKDTIEKCTKLFEKKMKAGKLTIKLCNLATYIAIRQGDPGLRVLALHMADTLVEGESKDLDREDARASIHWGLSRYRTSVLYADRARRQVERRRLPVDRVLSNYAYYVADATFFGWKVAPEHIRRAPKVALEVSARPWCTS